MMILKFEEYLKEGLWSKGLERAQSGEERIEDKNNNYFKVDDYNYFFKFKWGKTIKTCAIEIYTEPNPEDIVAIFKYPNIKKINGPKYIITNVYGNEYNVDNENVDVDVDMLIDEFDDENYYDILHDITTPEFVININNTIKNKLKPSIFSKPINEGLWSKGLERAQSGEERIEDKLPEGQYRVKNFPNFGFILDLDENGDIYIDIIRLPIDENDDPIYFISIPFMGKCPTFSKKYYEDNIRNNGNVNIHEIEIIESEKFRKALNDTLKSLPEKTWTNEYFLEEGLWSKGLERAQSGEIRKEDGKRVKSPWGFEMILHNPNFDYISLMKEILDNKGEDPMGIDLDSIGNWENYNHGRERLKKIKQGEDPYAYIIKDHHYIASFDTYEIVVDEDMYDVEGENIDEHDYIEVIKAIVDKLKTVDFGKTKGSYSYEIRLLLMDEDREYDYECNMSETTRDWFWDDFKNWFEEKYPDAELETWSYANYGANIGVELNYDNLNDFQNMKEEVEDYYKYAIENQDDNEE